MVDTKLKMNLNQTFRYMEETIEPWKKELVSFLKKEHEFESIKFAKDLILPEEIKTNNAIEGINDDIQLIESVIQNKGKVKYDKESQRIINLYRGYQYIFTHRQMNENTLRELYHILSNHLLMASDMKRMGDYYRKAPVYILKNGRLDIEPYQGMPYQDLDFYMDSFFEYVNGGSSNDEIESFLKSQIMHFYFVYVHPYFDVNGRTSRTVAMWYLLNHKAYPYVLFNRAIMYAKKEYEDSIIKGRKGNITPFLEYMMKSVLKELEMEYVIRHINNNQKEQISLQEKEILNIILRMNGFGPTNVKELAFLYSIYNDKIRPYTFYNMSLKRMIEKEILLSVGNSKSYMKSDELNIKLILNPKVMNVEEDKVRHLHLSRWKNIEF